MIFNANHVAGVSRRQVKKFTNVVQNVKFVDFHYHIRNHHEKCIQISINIPSIGFVTPEITREILRKTTQFRSVKPMARVVSVSTNHAAGVSRRHVQNCAAKMSTKNVTQFLNFVTLFGITMRNAFK